jgi:aminomethyltransferase
VAVGTAFHARTLPLAGTLSFRDWAGFYAVSAFEAHHEHEYNAIRNGCALIDISPLFKYQLTGPDAVHLVDRVITRDASRIAVGQVVYTPWCDDDGKVIDDGTVARLAADRFRWTAADPNLRWITQHAAGLRVEVEDVSEQVAALALQGPTSARLLAAVSDLPIATLKYFRAASGSIAGVAVEVTRTGYTGDLGYELWMPWDRAVDVWDALIDAGRGHALRPAGMLALDVARVEAGLLLTDVDFHSSRKASIDPQMYSPAELGLGRLVALDKGPAFVGRDALRRERAAGHRRQIVGLEVRWTDVEALYQAVGLPPTAPAAASRVAVPVYRNGQQVGKATTTAWSPTLKRLIALATVDRPHFAPGTELQIEVTVEATRYTAAATVVPTPFLDLPRRTALPDC